MKFQIIDSHYEDETVILFGKNENNDDVKVYVSGFKPYYYIKKDSLDFIDSIGYCKVQRYDSINNCYNFSYNSESKIIYDHFRNDEKEELIKVSFNSLKEYKNSLKKLESENNNLKIKVEYKHEDYNDDGYDIDNKKMVTDETSRIIYENKIDPLLRFFHNKNILPCGWVEIPDEKSKNGIYNISYNELKNVSDYDNKYAKFKTMAYDIECESSHGDFPLAIKDYSLLLNEIDNKYNKNKEIDKLFLNESVYNFINKFRDNFKNNKKENIDEKSIINDFIEMIYNYFITSKDTKLSCSKNKEINKYIDKYLPDIYGDKVVQIASCFNLYGETKIKKHLLTISNDVNNLEKNYLEDDEIEIVRCESETELLNIWLNLILSENPDIITGYNIYNFDGQYIFDRCIELGLTNKRPNEEYKYYHGIRGKTFNRINKISKLSQNYGLIKTKLIDSIGRIQLDIFKYVQKAYGGLSSYKLDDVSAEFITGKIIEVDENDNHKIKLSNVEGLHIGNYIQIKIHNRFDVEDYYQGGKKKFEILDINDKTLTLNTKIELNNTNIESLSWCLGKDDIKPIDIFNAFRENGTEKDKLKIGKYCVMDTVLCLELMNKLKIISNIMSMANVCYCPMKYIILRGEGIKTLSLVSKKCQENNFVLPTLIVNEDDNADYEGAIVLPPKTGLYLKEPVSVLDYTSLYPSSMISKNLSHETFINIDKFLDEKNVYLKDEKEKINRAEIELNKIGFESFTRINYENAEEGKYVRRIKIDEEGKKEYLFVQNGKKGIIPTILTELMSLRKRTKKEMKQFKKFSFEYDLLDSKQLAYKLTANSIYGQMGSKYSQVFKKEIAESTTAVGREQLKIARDFVKVPSNYNNYFSEYNLKYYEMKNTVVYGDTDSIFVKFDARDENCNILSDKEALVKSIHIAEWTEKQIGEQELESPQILEYEKTFYPFILLGKKKYIGMKYEKANDNPKQSNMGVVLKRRDNALILKIIYDSIINKLITERTEVGLKEFLYEQVDELIKGPDGKYDISKLTITKRLNEVYKDRTKIAHAVLADRIGIRDPGNKPNSGDRIQFVYIDVESDEKVLQGDKIETPDYVINNDNIKPDFNYYYEHQIETPVGQIFDLLLEKKEREIYNKEITDLIKNL